jgi:hypothetical protein
LAKGDAIKAAANLGATHVVWVEQENGPPARVKAKAYRCTR